MSDIDEQLKVIRLQKEQLELERLLAQKRARKLLVEFPVAVGLGVGQGVSRGGAAVINALRRYGVALASLLLVITVCGVAYGSYVLWQERQEELANKKMLAKINAIVATTCATTFAYDKQCEDRRMRGTLSDAESIACFNQNDESRRCELNARRDAYRSLNK